jgi:hypothetical protein
MEARNIYNSYLDELHASKDYIIREIWLPVGWMNDEPVGIQKEALAVLLMSFNTGYVRHAPVSFVGVDTPWWFQILCDTGANSH